MKPYISIITIISLLCITINCKKTNDIITKQEDINSSRSFMALSNLVKTEYLSEGNKRLLQYVTDENSDLIYLGAVFNGKDLIEKESYLPLTNFTKLPIRMNGTFNSVAIVGTILERPRMSTYRQKIRDLFYADSNIIESGGFEYSYRTFNNYDSLNKEFATSRKTSKFFSSSTTSITNINKKISKKKGIVLQFIQPYYRTTVDLPKANELMHRYAVDSMVIKGINPVYINTITYGRMGVLTVESDYFFEEVSSTFNSISKKLFKKKSESFTQEEIKVLNEATMNIYIIGGIGSVGAFSVTGASHLQSIIKNGYRPPNIDNPGVPISFTMRYLKDLSPVFFNY